LDCEVSFDFSFLANIISPGSRTTHGKAISRKKKKKKKKLSPPKRPKL
jgi:hypothetical protein